MNILHVISYIGKAQGGPVEYLRLLSSAQAKPGNTVRIIHTGITDDGDKVQFPENIEITQIPSFGPMRWAPKFMDAVSSDGFLPDIIHIHGLWMDIGRQACRLSRQLRVPFIISPCGMLQKGALEKSRIKKNIAWLMFQKKVLSAAAILHAKSHAEAEEISRILPRSKVAVIPNPVERPPEETELPMNKNAIIQSMSSLFGLLQNHKAVLFLGRLHPVKGLERLIDAWTHLYKEFPDWYLVIVGPDQGGYRSRLESRISRKTLREKPTGASGRTLKTAIRFIDGIFGSGRWAAYARADIFIAPSDFENFGQSIAEALSAGIPVITTTGTPWEILKEKNCGWWVPPSPEDIASALKEAMSLTESERKNKAIMSKQLSEKFSPHAVAQQMTALYQSLH